MPLMKNKSKKAMEHNIKAEVHAGKPLKQALAIAYSVKRHAKKKAHGGMIEHDEDMRKMEHMAKGGMVEHDEDQKPVHVDDSFLSAEDGSETPFLADSLSDEQELDEAGVTPVETHLDNEEGDEDQESARKATLSDIMRKVRMRHMGK